MLSIIVITKNEEANIARCLESVCFADEIIVIDSGSTDETLTIARRYTDKVFSTTDWQGYGIQKQRALAQATGDWVLNLDADEYVSLGLRKVIQESIKSPDIDAYRIPIHMCFSGQALKYSASPSRHIRLFKRIGASYSKDIVHEKIILPEGVRIKQLKQPILHNSFHDLSHALYKLNKYSSYSAKIRVEKNKKISFARVLLATIWMFGRCFILQRGFLDGRLGFFFSFYSAQGAFYRGMKQLYPDLHREQLLSIKDDL